AGSEGDGSRGPRRNGGPRQRASTGRPREVRAHPRRMGGGARRARRGGAAARATAGPGAAAVAARVTTVTRVAFGAARGAPVAARGDVADAARRALVPPSLHPRRARLL